MEKDNQPCYHYRVLAEHVPLYLDPITLKAGEAMVTDGREDNWQGHIWVWCVNYSRLKARDK